MRGRTAHVAPRLRDLDGAAAHEARTAAPARGRRRGPAAAPTGRTDLWLPIGPATVLRGQASGRPRVLGRIRALAVHPLGDRVYAAAADGGVWYSGDGGATWAALGGFAPTPALTSPAVAHRHSCGAILVEWGATEDLDTVFVGTGEPVAAGGLPGGSRRGLGVLSAVGPVGADLAADPWHLEGREQLEGAGIHRIARRPGGGAYLVAATNGLWQRGATPGDPYTRVAGAPFATLQGEVTDVLWTAAGGGAPERVWAYVQAGASRGVWVRDDGGATWTRVFAPTLAGRGKLAATDPATTVYLFRDLGDDNSLRRFDAGAGPVTSALVAGVPNAVGTQGFYDMALAVDPANQQRVALGGSLVQTTDPAGTAAEFDGAIFTGTVPPGAAPAFTGSTHVGIGVHADVHDLVYSNGGARLWAACDGGLYRSDAPALVAGFRAVNDRRPVIEPNYLAVHPRHEGFVVAGLQDNGTIERASGEVWRNRDDGDGGGVVLRPDSPDVFVHQFFTGQWTPIDPLDRPGLAGSTATERDASVFYSAPAAVLHTRPGPPPVPVGQLLVGTTRVWMTQDFGATWATLPTGTDAEIPLHRPAQDRLRSSVVACRWQGEDEAWVLCRNEVYLFSREVGSDTATSVGRWTRHLELQRTFASPTGSARALAKRSPTWTDLAVDPDPASPGSRRGARGAFYLGTTGRRDDPAVDTLYWFDGDLTLHATGLRSEVGGVPAPVTAIAPDPATPGTVYVGTSVGVWRGVRTFAGAVPDWDWAPLVNGLPEAPVEDLSLFDAGGVRLLRAAVSSRGVWELRLGADAQDLTYVRVHEDDMRHQATTELVNRSLVGERSWHASPDVRPRLATSVVPPPTALAPWTFGTQPPPGDLRRFQAACRSRFGDLRFRANGLWDRYFDELLRDNGAPVVAGAVTVDPAFFAGVMVPPHVTADPWPGAAPTEADLHDLLPPLPDGSTDAASTVVAPAPHRVDVVVHRRGLDPVAGADVRVTLLQWLDDDWLPWNRARPDDTTTWPTDPVPFAAAVNEVLDGTGVPASAVGDGWSFVGTSAATRRRSPTGTLDGTTSGVVTFDLDLSGLAHDTVVLLVAVIRADGPTGLAPAPLRDLTLGNPHVAVRSLRVQV